MILPYSTILLLLATQDFWISRRPGVRCLFFAPMSFQVERWISDLPQLPDEDVRRLQEAVEREKLERQHNQQHDQLVFKKLKAKCRGTDFSDESSFDDSPGE